MASGRVGGTRSKISGQVGEEVYQIRKNNDGTYTQVITAKGETTVNYTTPRLQAQRMCTSMIEAMMRDLREVGKISMQSAASKSKSLNAFSSYNLQLVARDCKANWYFDNQFVYPKLDRFDIKQRDLGGLYMLSSGTLQFNVFAGRATQGNPSGGLIDYPNATHAPEGIYFLLPSYECSIGEFLQANRMTRLDTVVFCMFGMYTEYNAETEEDDIFYKHNYMIAQINPALSDGVAITDDILPQLFLGSSNRSVVCKRYAQWPYIFLGFDLEIIDKSEEPYTWGAFSISYADGKKKISSSSYKWFEDFDNAWLRGHAPADVFGTWMGEPLVKPYQSPFDPSPIPHVPSAYREVEWLSSSSTIALNLSFPYNIRTDVLEIQVQEMGAEVYGIIGDRSSSNIWRIALRPNAVRLIVISDGGTLNYNDVQVRTQGVLLNIKMFYSDGQLNLTVNGSNVSIPESLLPTGFEDTSVRLWKTSADGADARVGIIKCSRTTNHMLDTIYYPCVRLSDSRPCFWDSRAYDARTNTSMQTEVSVGPYV